MKHYITSALAASLLCGASAIAGGPAAPYDNSRIDARLNVTVKENTDVVHFVRDNADPSVYTKAYIVKYVDPYELRTYLRKIVQTRKVNDDNTNVEAVKFTDGTSVLLVSAEDYRFDDTPGAQGIDSIIRELDSPGWSPVRATRPIFTPPSTVPHRKLRQWSMKSGFIMPTRS